MNEPLDLLLAAIGAGIGGVILILISDSIMRAIGMDINQHAREGRRLENLDFTEKLRAFYSDPRNFLLLIGFFGFILLFGAFLMALAAGVWFLYGLV